jgi:hypothetical protein
VTRQLGHTALPTQCPKGAQLSDGWWRRIADMTNDMLHGGLNNVLDITLTANAATTTITDNRIGGTSRPTLQAMSASAATEAVSGNLWVAAPGKYTVVIHHTNSGVTDRSFSMMLGG